MPPKKSNPKGKYIICSNHVSIPGERDVTNYVSFDPGLNNFDIRFESRGPGEITTRAHAKYVVPIERHRTSTGTYSVAVSTIVDILDSYQHLLEDTHIVLIEDQMCVNNNMMLVYTGLVTYFLCKYPNMLVVAPVAKLKGTLPGAPPKMKHDELKAWGEGMATRLATQRKDYKFLAFLEAQRSASKDKKAKVDDSTDNLIQIEAWCIHVGYKSTAQLLRCR